MEQFCVDDSTKLCVVLGKRDGKKKNKQKQKLQQHQPSGTLCGLLGSPCTTQTLPLELERVPPQ